MPTPIRDTRIKMDNAVRMICEWHDQYIESVERLIQAAGTEIADIDDDIAAELREALEHLKEADRNVTDAANAAIVPFKNRANALEIFLGTRTS